MVVVVVVGGGISMRIGGHVTSVAAGGNVGTIMNREWHPDRP